MGIVQRATVECDHAGCGTSIVVRCTLRTNKVPGPVVYDFEYNDLEDSGWQEIHDHYDDIYSYYCPEHKRKTRY
jgi:hypothetical protein